MYPARDQGEGQGRAAPAHAPVPARGGERPARREATDPAGGVRGRSGSPGSSAQARQAQAVPDRTGGSQRVLPARDDAGAPGGDGRRRGAQGGAGGAYSPECTSSGRPRDDHRNSRRSQRGTYGADLRDVRSGDAGTSGKRVTKGAAAFRRPVRGARAAVQPAGRAAAPRLSGRHL